jgi:predicted RND superfamily exporter protein
LAKKSKKFASVIPLLSRRAPWIVCGMMALTLVAAIGLRYTHVSLNFPNIFRQDEPFQRGLAEMDEGHSGGASFEIIMEAVDGTDFSEREKLKLMASLQTALSLTAPITTTLSPIDIGLTQYVLTNGLPKDPAALTGRAGALVGDMRRADASPLENWLSDDLTKARIHARVRTDRQQHYDQLVSALEYLRGSFATRGVKISWSGFALLYKEMERRMVRELMASFAIAFAGVLIFMSLLFRSVKWGILSMIPNLLPVAVTVGIMSWAGVGFSLGLIILPAVGLGLVVDDTIHVVWGMRRYIHDGCETEGAVAKVLSTTGRALVLSTVILAAGFASLAFSPFISNNQLAVFMPLLLVLALAFDLIGIPSVLFLRRRRAAPMKDSYQGSPARMG